MKPILVVENVSKKFSKSASVHLNYGIRDLMAEILGRSSNTQLRQEEFLAYPDGVKIGCHQVFPPGRRDNWPKQTKLENIVMLGSCQQQIVEGEDYAVTGAVGVILDYHLIREIRELSGRDTISSSFVILTDVEKISF